MNKQLLRKTCSKEKPAMSAQNAIPEHLSEKMTISFWLWNYFYGIKKGEFFHDLEQCFVELKERGFNTVRVDSGAGLCHTADGEPRGQIRLHEPFPGYSNLRQMDMRTDMATKGGCQCNVLDKVVELFELARKYDVRVILSSWFYLHTFWFVEDDLVEEFFALPPEERFMRFAVDTDRILAVLKARGLQGQIAFVEIFNEFDNLTSQWKLDKRWKTDSEKLQGMHDFRRWHEEALDILKARHPDLLFAIDTCHSGVNREILPRNAHVWNHHMYYSWGAYWKVFETPVYENGFDFANAGTHPALGRFLRSPLIPIEAVRSCRKHLQYVEHSWPIRVWLYNNLDERKLPALELLLDEHLTNQITEYKKAIDDSIRMALETRQALFPDILLVVGEGATYCGHPKMRWEEKSNAYWELVDYATRRLKDEGYWGCVARTNSGPEDPSWSEFPARLRHATAAYAGNAETGGRYAFDGKISREVLENYLARSLHMLGLADSKQFDEDLRMIKNVGAKQIGRVAGIWWAGDGKADVEAHFARAKTAADRLHKMDPELMLQACIFETVGKGANEIPIPAWVFEEFGQKPEARTFRCESIGYDDGWPGHGHGCIPPDMSKPETKMWFYYWGRRYIDCGYENIHLGMIGHMDRKDPGHANWFDTLGRLRRYAARHARRHMVLFDSQLSGIAEDGKLLLDYHNMVLRPKDVIGSPEKCILEMGYGDTIWGRSAGGVTPSGWSCEHLPYQAEIDNGYAPGKAGQNIGFPYAWGSIEIDWFARQPEAYRNEWLRYAWDWIRKNDPNGYLQMQGSKCLNPSDVRGASWYYANTKSEACSNGFNQEETIKAIWQNVPGK